MNNDWDPVAIDSIRECTFFLHKTSSPLEVMNGAVGDVELTTFVQQATQTTYECSVQLAWHTELYGADQPTTGQILEAKLSGQQLFVGIIQGITDFNLVSGSKKMTVVARSRDSLPHWRNMRKVTDIYPVATPVTRICRDIAASLGLATAEVDIPEGSVYTVHSNTQLADLTPWQMITTLLESSGVEPYVDARGKLKTISRDTQRVSDIVMTDNRRVNRVTGSKLQSPVTEVRIKWLDPNLTEVAQQAQALDRATITAGFFQLYQHRDVKFSNDERQRARNTYLVIKQTANSGLLPVCEEEYEQLTQTKGMITLTTSAWVPGLAISAMYLKWTAHSTPDGVIAFGVGVTVPQGRLLEYIADAVLFLTMMSIGTGVYEVWGTPYDYVHARNTTVAYKSTAKPWELNATEIENDFVMNESQAQAYATRELIYNHRSASSWGIKIVDDPRIEKGDIVELSDGTRIYVTGYTRDLSNGAAALLDIQGFAVPLTGSSVGVPAP